MQQLDNSDRLEALAASRLLGGVPEEQFDRLTRIATRLLGTPVALVSLVDDHRQFFKAQIGLAQPWADQRQTPLSHSFCQHVVTSGKALVVSDAEHDERVVGNLAIAELGVRAYCGVPLRTNDGHVLGSFCAIDSRSRQWTDEDIAVLEDLAAIVMTEINLRQSLNEERILRREKDEMARTLQAALLPPTLPVIPGLELSATYLPRGAGTSVGGDFYDVYGSEDGWHLVLGDVCGKGLEAARTTMVIRAILRAHAPRSTVSDTLRLVDESLRDQGFPFVALTHLGIRKSGNGLHGEIILAGQPRSVLIRNSQAHLVGQYGSIIGSELAGLLRLTPIVLDFEPGDILLIYSDGVTDSAAALLSEDELAQSLTQMQISTAAKAVEATVKLAHGVEDLVRTPTDDIAVLALSVNSDGT